MRISRRSFVALAAAPFFLPGALRAQDDADPASSSALPALRVLLGIGEAQTLTADTFAFNGRTYRGTFARLDDGRIVNVVPLEAYLYGVVPHEMSPGWPLAALCAQAICARTYVLARSDPRKEYDLVPSELSQVYQGMSEESPAGSEAVDATAGAVLTFARNFAQVAYSSCCGGHTEASFEAWGSAPLPYLGGVVCRYCTASPNYRWTAEIESDAVAQAFTTALGPLGSLTGLRIGARDGSGRARSFELVADRGTSTVRGTAFRLAVGARTLRSLLVTDLRKLGNSFAFSGGGLGHGVGLCQWGARGMAQTGASAAQILALYFPGTLVEHYQR